MAYITNYNSAIHDLYIFGGTPTIDPTNYSNNTQFTPQSYNNSLYIKNPLYNLPSIDFSGIGIRNRGAPAYGWDQFDGHLASGITINPSTGNISFPDIVSQFQLYDIYTSSADCYYPGCPTPGNYTYASDYNFWNNGQFATILISPKHCIATAHYVGAGMSTSITFLGKNNQTYTKSATKVLDLRNGPILPPGYDWSSVIGSDICLFELNTSLNATELQQIKIYKFLNNYGIPSNVPSFDLIPQGMVVVTKASANDNIDGLTHYFNPTVYPNAAYQGIINEFGNSVILAGNSWNGDSGTPSLVYVPKINETCFFQLKSGGGGIFYDFSTPNKFFDLLKQYIYDQISYQIELVDYTENPAPPTPEVIIPPRSFNANGVTFYIDSILDVSPGKGSILNYRMHATPGFTYAVAIRAYNQNSVSAPIIVSNIYLPDK